MSDANYYDRFSNNQQQETPQKQKKQVVDTSAVFSITKVFMYMFVGLLITAAIALGLGAYFGMVLLKDAGSNIETRIQATNAIVLLVLLITSFIAILVLSFVVPIVAVRGKHSVLVPAILYSVFMGIALSSLTIFINWTILGLTFGITALVFGLMALIAFLSKSRLNGLAIAAIGLFAGAGILSLALWILMICGVFSEPLYWVISLLTFAAVMLITIWDMARIKYIAEKGEMTKNVSLYCAYILYNDFIVIFLKILRFVLIIFGNGRK